MLPFVPTTIPSNPARFVCHGPDGDDAERTVAELPGVRLLHVSTPFWLKNVITDCPNAEFIPVSNCSNIKNVTSLVFTWPGCFFLFASGVSPDVEDGGAHLIF